MHKFYVQCGKHSLIICENDALSAAMTLLDRLLSDHTWIYQDRKLTDLVRIQHLMVEALLHFAPEITVSERGLGRDDALRVGVPETLLRWHKSRRRSLRLRKGRGAI